MATENQMEDENKASFLGMSDEAMSEVDIGAVSRQASEAPVAAEAETPLEGEDAPIVATGDQADPDADAVDADDKGDAGEDPDQADKDAADDKPDGEGEGEGDEVDYKAVYERLKAPFKANGKEITIDSVDDAISLMQMGANYNKKMAALKPNLRMLKLLENNGLLDEDKLSYLIELDKKSPDAISKLVKDSGIDPLELSTDTDKEYVPKKHKVEDIEIELDTVLNELEETPTYNRTLDVVGKKWDAASKTVIANAPQILKVINNHMQNGIYDQISAEVENERMFGRLEGLSDIEAYRQVGDAIQARGGFDHLGHQRQQTSPPVVVTPKPKQADDAKLKDKKRAASSSKPVAPSSNTADFNPLALSDEAFEQQIKSKYL